MPQGRVTCPILAASVQPLGQRQAAEFGQVPAQALRVPLDDAQRSRGALVRPRRLRVRIFLIFIHRTACWTLPCIIRLRFRTAPLYHHDRYDFMQCDQANVPEATSFTFGIHLER